MVCQVLLNSYLEVAALIQSVWGAKDSHLPVVEVRLSHQSDAEAFQRLLLQGFQLHHQGLLGTRGCLVGHVNPTSDTGGEVKGHQLLMVITPVTWYLIFLYLIYNPIQSIHFSKGSYLSTTHYGSGEKAKAEQITDLVINSFQTQEPWPPKLARSVV